MNFVNLLFVIAILLALGSALRRMWRKKRPRSTTYSPMNLPSESRAAFLLCTFSMLAKLAQSDGEVSASERAKISEYMQSHLKLDSKTEKVALRIFQDALDSPLELADYAKEFSRVYPDRVKLNTEMINILLDLSVSDAVVSPPEDELIRSAALSLGLSTAAYEQIKKSKKLLVASIN